MPQKTSGMIEAFEAALEISLPLLLLGFILLNIFSIDRLLTMTILAFMHYGLLFACLSVSI